MRVLVEYLGNNGALQISFLPLEFDLDCQPLTKTNPMGGSHFIKRFEKFSVQLLG